MVNRALTDRSGLTDALAHPLRTWRTVKHLEPAQVVNRAWRALSPVTRVPDVLHASLRRREAVRPVWQMPAREGQGFRFLNRYLACAGEHRWNPLGADDLWRYHLHYFRYLWEMPAADAVGLVTDWIAVNTDPRSFEWDPYPTSIRVREWIEWLLAHDDVPAGVRDAVLRSVAAQTEVLQRRLEYHLMGNHLLENAITLCWVGLTLEARSSRTWTRAGARLLARELERQVLSDGSHDERSPMYQASLAESLMRLSAVAAASSTPDAVRIRALSASAAERLVVALAPLVHPDGDYALFNDSALNAAPPFAALRARLGRVVPRDVSPARQLASAGYLAHRDGDRQYLVFDAGPIGPQHQPGHGHADTLSFELSCRGRRVITDTGVFTYSTGSVRSYDRSTAAHNTVQVDGENQCELWGAFRCGRRPSVETPAAAIDRTGAVLSGGYRGASRAGHVRHHRQIVTARSILAFTDELRVSGERMATLRLHLAPEFSARRSSHGIQIEDRAGRSVAAAAGDGFAWDVTTSAYHPEFGVEVERTSLVAKVRVRHSATLKWWLLVS